LSAYPRPAPGDERLSGVREVDTPVLGSGSPHGGHQEREADLRQGLPVPPQESAGLPGRCSTSGSAWSDARTAQAGPQYRPLDCGRGRPDRAWSQIRRSTRWSGRSLPLPSLFRSGGAPLRTARTARSPFVGRVLRRGLPSWAVRELRPGAKRVAPAPGGLSVGWSLNETWYVRKKLGILVLGRLPAYGSRRPVRSGRETSTEGGALVPAIPPGNNVKWTRDDQGRAPEAFL
jgi:hypothetical protein